jgi:acyl-CoA thioesterase FadM
MAYFASSHRVLYHDTMAQGTHHFLTNFKFQCEAREQFFFGEIVDRTPNGRSIIDAINVVTLDGYARSLAPVEVGETVGILVSIEERTPSSLRFCFRVIRRDGTPVSVGFQTIVTVSRHSGAIVVGRTPSFVRPRR